MTNLYDISKLKVSDISSDEAPDMDELSAEEIRVIDRVMEKYEKINIEQMYKESHDDAWKKAMERAEDDPKGNFLSWVDIAREGGASEEMLDNIRRNEGKMSVTGKERAAEISCRPEQSSKNGGKSLHPEKEDNLNITSEKNMETQDDSKFRILGISKTKAVLIYITKVSGDKWDFTSLLNKLYLVQKAHLVRYGKPLVNEYFSADEMGPTPVFTYNAFRYALGEFPNAPDDLKRFASVFTVEKTSEGGNVFIGGASDIDELSAEEKSIIEAVVKKYDRLTVQQQEAWVCDDAWKNAYKRGEKDPNDGYLYPEDMARSGGASAGILSYIRSQEELNSTCGLN
jgi:uncharacterized phage-associated protein